MTPLRADSLTFPHAFFTREGGVSAGLYASFNCGPGSRDDPAAVAANREAARAALGARALLTLHQTHSATAVTVAAPWEGARPEGDALVTKTPGLALGALHADCAPILMEDREARVVAAVHAGWRGALAGVAEAAVDAMAAAGADRARIRAAIGPCISQRAYEVGPEFLDEFVNESEEYVRFFAGGAGDRMMFDLPGFLLARLRAAGVEAEWIGRCTASDEARFFSHRRGVRRGEPDYGRLLSAIVVPAD